MLDELSGEGIGAEVEKGLQGSEYICIEHESVNSFTLARASPVSFSCASGIEAVDGGLTSYGVDTVDLVINLQNRQGARPRCAGGLGLA